MRILPVVLVIVACLTRGEVLVGAERCTCIGTSATCGSITEADAVFEATVESQQVNRASPDVWSTGDPRVVTLKDLRPYRGRATKVVTTADGEASCGYRFKDGERYLIFAYANSNGGLSVSSCSLTRPVSKARGLLAYLQSPLPASAPPPSRVWGTVQRAEKWNGFERDYVGVPGARVTFKGRTTHTVRTGADGSYMIRTLPPGRYAIAVTPPASIPELGAPLPWGGEFDIGVDKASACVELGSILRIKSAVSGLVVDEQGQPLGNVFVQLQLPDQVDRTRGAAGGGFTTGPDGRYVFDDLPPGRYVIGLNLEKRAPTQLFPFATVEALTPTGDTVIALKFGEQIVLQPLVARRR